MPTPQELRDLPPTLQTLVAEAGGEGLEGMKRVAKVIHSRRQLPRWSGLTTDQIVQQPKQFSGWERPDRLQFLSQQPDRVFREAARALREAERESSGGNVFADHYLTTRLFDSPTRPAWAKKMRVVERFGGHVFLKE